MQKGTARTSFPFPFCLRFLSLSLLSLFYRAMTQRLNAVKPESSSHFLFHSYQMLPAEDVSWSAGDLLLG